MPYVNKDNWREYIKPIQLDLKIKKGEETLIEKDDYGTESTTSKNSAGKEIRKPKQWYMPEERMARFNVIPNKEKLFWMEYYYAPYQASEFNTAPCMRFDVDEKTDYLIKMETIRMTR